MGIAGFIFRGDLVFDFVLVTTGVRPNTDFLRDSGIQLGIKGTVVVNKYMQTNFTYIYAAGDCVQTASIITGQPVYYDPVILAARLGRKHTKSK
ncbi:MAG: FAD-dependent oxidoreductase [Bacillota bacterium]